MEEDTDFAEELKRVFNNDNIPEVFYFTPEVLEDTYVDIQISLRRDGEGKKFVKVKKCLRYENGIPIGTHHDNPMLDPRVYEIEYLYRHKASLYANTIAKNLF